MLERTLEQKLVAKVRALGGLAVKWTAPSMAGVPDRIVFLPGGVVRFVELKAPGKKPSALQQRFHGILRDLGADVRVVDSEEGIDAVLA